MPVITCPSCGLVWRTAEREGAYTVRCHDCGMTVAVHNHGATEQMPRSHPQPAASSPPPFEEIRTLREAPPPPQPAPAPARTAPSERRRQPRPRQRDSGPSMLLIVGLIVFGALLIFGAVVWLALPTSGDRDQPARSTTLAANSGPPLPVRPPEQPRRPPAQPPRRPPVDEPKPDEPLPEVRQLFVTGPVVYLADMQEFGVKSGPWPITKNGTTGSDKNDAIRVGGKLSPKGIGMHPPSNPAAASVKYRLGKQAAVLQATVAIDDRANFCFTPAVFMLVGDGKELFKSKWIAHNHLRSEECRVDVKGVDVLELRVYCVGHNTGVHAVWVEPRLLQRADTLQSP